jgi:hypothetical protein
MGVSTMIEVHCRTKGEAYDLLMNTDWVEEGMNIVISPASKRISRKQINALNLFCGMQADAYNSAGLDQKVVLGALFREATPIPWTKETFKANVWKVLMEAMTGEESTNDLNSVEPSQIYEQIVLMNGERLGVPTVPFPSMESLMNKSLGRE